MEWSFTTGRDESRNGKIPYRPTPYTIYTDRISFLQENSKFKKNLGKSGKFGNEIGGSFFLTEFSVPVFYTGIPEFFPFFPFTQTFSNLASPRSNLLVHKSMLQCSVAKVGLNRRAVLLPTGLLPGCPAPACTWASSHGLLATVGMGQIVGGRVMVRGICTYHRYYLVTEYMQNLYLH